MRCCIILLSCAVNRRWVFQTAVESNIFNPKSSSSGRLLNIWIIIIGKSRVSRKTSGVIRPVNELYAKVFGTKSMLSQAFTPESLLEQLSGMASPASCGELETVCFWSSDEIAWFFQQLKEEQFVHVNNRRFPM